MAQENCKDCKYCRRPRECQLAAISRIPPKNSAYEPRPRKPSAGPPPRLPQATNDERWYWGGLAVMVLASVGIACAHKSPEIRDWLTLYAPWMDDFIAILYQENLTYRELAIQCIISIKNYIDTLKHNAGQQQCNPEGKAITDVARNARLSQPEDGKTATR